MESHRLIYFSSHDGTLVTSNFHLQGRYTATSFDCSMSGVSARSTQKILFGHFCAKQATVHPSSPRHFPISSLLSSSNPSLNHPKRPQNSHRDIKVLYRDIQHSGREFRFRSDTCSGISSTRTTCQQYPSKYSGNCLPFRKTDRPQLVMKFLLPFWICKIACWELGVWCYCEGVCDSGHSTDFVDDVEFWGILGEFDYWKGFDGGVSGDGLCFECFTWNLRRRATRWIILRKRQDRHGQRPNYVENGGNR